MNGSTSTPVLQAEDLSLFLRTHQGGHLKIVDGVTFTIGKGDFYAVVGESGSGKTVLGRSIMRLFPPAMLRMEGKLSLNGVDLVSAPSAQVQTMRGRVVSMIFQEPMTSLNPLMTVERQIAEALAVAGEGSRRERSERVLDLLASVQFADPKSVRSMYPHELSGGMRQRAMIAMALANNPALLIADEPTTALDVTIQQEIMQLLLRLRDQHALSTFDVVTKEPASSLLGQLFDKFTITSEEIFKTQGGVASYNTAPIGWGPYKLTNFAISDRIALERHDAYPAKVETSPRNVLFRRIPEPDQRVTALLNGEVQIARLIPPQLVGRLENVPSVEIRRAPSNEPMFIGFSVKTKPWDDPRVRRAAAMAINKDVIIQRILFGMADRLDGPVGAQQICYTTPIDQKTPYDVAGARKLLAEAGYAGGGPVVDFFTATGRYISDRQIAEAITQMLNQAGFKATLHTPEFAGLWANVRAGKAPMYYMGRGLALEPSEWLSQYFETGVTPRIGYDNPKLNELFERERKTFDIIERCKIIREISQLIETEAPGIFLWNHQYVSGVRKGVRYVPDASGEIWLPDVRL